MKDEKTSHIKAIIFDVGGVLINDNSLQRNEEITGRIKHQYRGWKKLNRKFSTGKISEKEFFDNLSKKFFKDPEHVKLIWNKWMKRIKERKEVFSLIKKLKKNRYKIAVLSNVNPTDYKHHVKLGHYDHFHVKILSHQVGYRKPSRSIYRLTLKKLKMKPNEVIFIDDKERNTKAAKALGMNTIIYRNFPYVIKELRKLGVRF